MTRLIPLFFLFIILSAELSLSQSTAPEKLWFFLRNRGPAIPNISTVDPQSLGISQRALKRRAKVLPSDRLIDERDFPVSQEHIDRIHETGVKIRAVSRWFNAVSVEGDPAQLSAIASQPFVHHLEQIATFVRPRPEMPLSLPAARLQKTETTFLNYGPSALQLLNINVPSVHNLGIHGDGVIVGMIDDGFNNHRTHNALKNIRVVAEYDFIYRDGNTSAEPWEFVEKNGNRQGDHGMGTLSSLAGFDEGHLIGVAFGVSVILAKTEIDSVEIHIEEDKYVEALEWIERLGADIASSSLGYREFDSLAGSYTYQDMDGRTAIVSRAAAVAAQKGVLLCTAMGNEGQQDAKDDTFTPGTLVAPADADSIISVGATFSDGPLAGFSGTGPTSDGRTKPEVVAQGLGVYWAISRSSSSYVLANGTSASTPLVAGAAALLLSAHPELTPMQVREALMNTATQINDGTPSTSSYPNNFYGWGKVNALDAVLYWGPVFSNQPSIAAIDSTLIVSTLIASKSGLVADSVYLHYRLGSSGPFQQAKMSYTAQANLYQSVIPRPSGTENFFGFFSAKENSGKTRLSPYNAPDSLFILNFLPPENFVLHNNYPNPFNGSTTISFDVPAEVNVTLEVYNLLGQRIRTVFGGAVRPGRTRKTWDGRDEFGRTVTSGIYFYRLITPTSALTKKLLYLK